MPRPPLVCPGCRGLGPDGALRVARLTNEAPGELLRCEGCGRRYPVVDGVPIVPPDLERWLAEEREVVLRRRDLSSAVEELLLAGAPRARGWDRLLATYAAPAGELVERVSDLVAGLRGEVLDLGCGRGLHGREDVTGLDASFAMARAFCGRGVVGDAADPPFLAHAFDAVLLLNVLDSCAAPRLVLGQADALLAPGGTLVLSCAFAFADGLTPPGERFGPDDLERALTGEGGPFALDLRYRLVERRDRLSWRLRVSERVVHEHSCLLLVAVKEER